MKSEAVKTYWAKIYMSGPIEQAKQVIRRLAMEDGICVTVEPTTFIYTGGEEQGFVVGLVNYPRFPTTPEAIAERAMDMALELRDELYQHSVMVMTPYETQWLTTRQ